MQRQNTCDTLFPTCPIRNILARLGDKWTLLVIYTLNKNGTMRFSELQREIPDVSQKMLTTTLRSLETDGLLNRKLYAEVPPRTEYSLTARGRSLLPHLDSLIGWAFDNMGAILADRERAGAKKPR